MNERGIIRTLAVAALVLAAPRSGLGQQGFWEVSVSEVSVSDRPEWSVSLAPSLTELYFTIGAAWEIPRELYVATRQGVGEAFGAGSLVTGLADVSERAWAPSLSTDGLQAYYEIVEDLGPTYPRLRHATREAPGDNQWSRTALLDAINDHMVGQGNRYVASPEISADGLELFFAAAPERYRGQFDLYVVARENAGESFQPANIRRLDDICLPTCDEWSPSISADGSTLFWSEIALPYRDGQSADIWMATRPDRESPFGNVRNLGSPANYLGYDSSPTISRAWPAAGSELFLSRSGGGWPSWDIYVATWRLDCNGNGVDDTEDISSGNSRDDDADGVPDECNDLQRPGDCTQDGKLNIADPVWLLNHFFGNAAPELPCDGGTAASPGAGALKLVDVNGDGQIDMADPIAMLGYLFAGGSPPVLGTRCVPIAGCPSACE